MYQDVLDLVSLLDLDADAHAVDAGLDEDALVLVARNRQGRQEDLGGRPGFDFGDIVSLGGLGCEVGQAEGGCQAAADGLEVRPKGLRLGGRQPCIGGLGIWCLVRTISKAQKLCQVCSRCRAGVVEAEVVDQRSCPRMERRQPAGRWGVRSGRDLPAESGEGMKVRTLFAGALMLAPSPPPCRTLPYAARAVTH